MFFQRACTFPTFPATALSSSHNQTLLSLPRRLLNNILRICSHSSTSLGHSKPTAAPKGTRHEPRSQPRSQPPPMRTRSLGRCNAVTLLARQRSTARFGGLRAAQRGEKQQQPPREHAGCHPTHSPSHHTSHPRAGFLRAAPALSDNIFCV